MALIAAARAHAINARREWGDYRDGWPQSAGIPPSELPGAADPATENPSNLAGSQGGEDAADGPPISQSFAAFARAQVGWSKGYRKQADGGLALFTSLMGDLPVNRVTGDTAETFRDPLRALPALHGKSLYAGMSPTQATVTAERLRDALRANSDTVHIGKETLARDRAQQLAEHLTMKTVNRHFTLFTSWGSWMEDSEERAAQLHRGKCPFAKKAFSKKAAKKEARLAGRNRVAFTPEALSIIFGAPLFLEPPPMAPSNDPAVQLEQAKFWSILIALYTGMRLGEIAMLYPGDLRVEDGIPLVALSSDADRSYKSEAGDRLIPLHPDLIELGLPAFARAMGRSRSRLLLPGLKDSAASDQRGANISKWFGRWRKELGVTSARTPFHAFRRSFETALKKRLVGADTLIDQLVGHEPGSTGAAHYTDPLPIRTKAEAVAKIDYGVDLSLVVAALRPARDVAAE